jgi:hypothetical protein
MSVGYKDIQWVVQQNLTNRDDFEQIRNACQKFEIDFVSICIVPFSLELPAFTRQKHSILYGSTTFNALAYNDETLREGMFFNEIPFSVRNHLDKWGAHMLNYGSQICTLREILDSKIDPGKLLFIRPNDDNKSFSGDVIQFGEIKEWYNKIANLTNANLSLESKIVVSEPYNIQFEWRLWIVNKKAVAASKYREYFRLKREEGCPKEVIEFAEQRCLEYTPHDVFVMDVCLSGSEYYIVECGCMNGAGFYKANIENIVRSVTDYFISHLESTKTKKD